MIEHVGWVKFHRKILSWGWYKDNNVKAVFWHLILTANRVEGRIESGHVIPVGATLTSYQKLAEELGMTKKQIRGTIDKLKRTQEVAHRRMDRGSLIQVNNWNEYQLEGHGGGHAKGTVLGTSRALKGHQYEKERSKEERRRAGARDFFWDEDGKNKRKMVDGELKNFLGDEIIEKNGHICGYDFCRDSDGKAYYVDTSDNDTRIDYPTLNKNE